ncbi:hypothetical protein [Streptomyces sp. NPDC096095]|uniref:hypothetical protein n=1 Tax=Streptomyces sp. NPDC096095 TaxID=3155545 RepID=UPI0033182841
MISFARAAVTGFASRSSSSAGTPRSSETNSASLSKSRRTTAAASRAAMSAAGAGDALAFAAGDMGIEDFGGGQAPQADVLVVTNNDIPGYQVTQVIGARHCPWCAGGQGSMRPARMA